MLDWMFNSIGQITFYPLYVFVEVVHACWFLGPIQQWMEDWVERRYWIAQVSGLDNGPEDGDNTM